jgi:hypothetical protein
MTGLRNKLLKPMLFVPFSKIILISIIMVMHALFTEKEDISWGNIFYKLS